MTKCDDQKPRSSCPDFSLLAELVEGSLEPRIAGVIDEHLVACAACSALRDRIRDTVRLLKDSEELLVQPPPSVERRVVEMGRTAMRERASTGRDVMFARLTRVGPAPVPAGVRGASGGAKEFLYESDLMDLRVQLRRGRTSALHLRGHAYPRSDKPVVLKKVLLRPDGGGREVEADLSGEKGFRVARLSPGRYSLVLQTEEDCVHCPDLETDG